MIKIPGLSSHFFCFRIQKIVKFLFRWGGGGGGGGERKMLGEGDVEALWITRKCFDSKNWSNPLKTKFDGGKAVLPTACNTQRYATWHILLKLSKYLQSLKVHNYRVVNFTLTNYFVNTIFLKNITKKSQKLYLLSKNDLGVLNWRRNLQPLRLLWQHPNYSLGNSNFEKSQNTSYLENYNDLSCHNQRQASQPCVIIRTLMYTYIEGGSIAVGAISKESNPLDHWK